MSEKRFSVRLRSECDGVVYSFFDGDKPLDMDMIVDLLNEQQAAINELKEAIDYLKTVIRYTIPNEMVADVFKQIGEEYE